jgi:hypothetical protein
VPILESPYPHPPSLRQSHCPEQPPTGCPAAKILPSSHPNFTRACGFHKVSHVPRRSSVGQKTSTVVEMLKKSSISGWKLRNSILLGSDLLSRNSAWFLDSGSVPVGVSGFSKESPPGGPVQPEFGQSRGLFGCRMWLAQVVVAAVSVGVADPGGCPAAKILPSHPNFTRACGFHKVTPNSRQRQPADSPNWPKFTPNSGQNRPTFAATDNKPESATSHILQRNVPETGNFRTRKSSDSRYQPSEYRSS